MDVGMLSTLQGIVDSNNDAICLFCIENAEEIIKNYCNIDSVPDGLKNTVLRMAADIFRRGAFGSSEIPMLATSVKIGDTSTSYSAISNTVENEIIDNYIKQLNRYRKVT